MSTKFYIKDDNGTFLSIDGKTRFSCLEGQALYQFLNSDQGKARRFDVEINDDGDRIGVEIAPEWGKRIRAERNHQEYLDQQKAASDIEFISYNLLVRANETEVEMIQTIADESVEVEAEAMKSIEISILRDALKHLSSAEYAIVFELFLSNSPLTELQLANKLNITQQAVSKRKKAILEKLRKNF